MTPEIYLTIDVEWACREVLADTLRLLDERGMRATFFCTHAGIHVPGHERALHPNFCRDGDTLRGWCGPASRRVSTARDEDVYRHVVRTTKAFCPEAVGVRAHRLFYDFTLVPVYRDVGLQYDSSCFLPMASDLRPVRSARDLVEIPIYYMDYWDLLEQASGWRLDALRLDQPGLKVFDFHPNLVFMNASTMSEYLASKHDYRDSERLLARRRVGRGVRTLFLDLLDFIVANGAETRGLAALTAQWREHSRR